MQNDDFEMQSTIMELKEEILGISPGRRGFMKHWRNKL